MSPASELLARLARLNVDRSNGQRKPHKPLLMLCAIQRWVVRGQRDVAFVEVEMQLRPLLDLYAPPVKGAHHPEYPYWYLQSDGVWELPQANALERSAKVYSPVEVPGQGCSMELPAQKGSSNFLLQLNGWA